MDAEPLPDSASKFPYSVADARDRCPPPAPQVSWFRTREARRYVREIAFVIVLKLVLLAVLWFGFIRPWPRPAAPPAAVVLQFYMPAQPPVQHD